MCRFLLWIALDPFAWARFQRHSAYMPSSSWPAVLADLNFSPQPLLRALTSGTAPVLSAPSASSNAAVISCANPIGVDTDTQFDSTFRFNDSIQEFDSRTRFKNSNQEFNDSTFLGYTNVLPCHFQKKKNGAHCWISLFLSRRCHDCWLRSIRLISWCFCGRFHILGWRCHDC